MATGENGDRKCKFCDVFITFDNADSRVNGENKFQADPVVKRHVRLYLTFILRAVIVFVHGLMVDGVRFSLCDRCKKRIKEEVGLFKISRNGDK